MQPWSNAQQAHQQASQQAARSHEIAQQAASRAAEAHQRSVQASLDSAHHRFLTHRPTRGVGGVVSGFFRFVLFVVWLGVLIAIIAAVADQLDW